MKHTLRVTLLLVIVFFTAQVVGLLVTNQYIDTEETARTGNATFTQLPFDIERPPIEESSSFIYIFIAILIGTVLILLLVRFRKPILWKVWYFLAVMLTLTISLAGFIPEYAAGIIAVVLAVLKIWRPNVYLHNITEVLIYGGLAAIFVPVMNLFAAVMLLLLIAGYDAYAVWKSGHMVKLAKFQTQAKVFAGLYVPYKRQGAAIPATVPKKLPKTLPKLKKARTAVLGGGDIGFPLLFAGVVMKGLMLEGPVLSSFLTTLIIPVCAALALLALLVKAEKGKFYPAMPFIAAGCFVGYGIVLLV